MFLRGSDERRKPKFEIMETQIKLAQFNLIESRVLLINTLSNSIHIVQGLQLREHLLQQVASSTLGQRLSVWELPSHFDLLHHAIAAIHSRIGLLHLLQHVRVNLAGV